MANKRLNRPRRTVSPAKRRAILEGARSVFLERGYGACRMDDVAAAAEVSKMTVYRHFSSKEELFVGVMKELCGRISWGDLETSLHNLPPEQALRRFARRFVAVVMSPETTALHRLAMCEIHRFPELGKLFYDNGPAVAIGALTRYFTEQSDTAVLNISNPGKSAEEFLELLRGYAHLRILLGMEKAPSKSKIEGTIDRALEVIIGGLPHGPDPSNKTNPRF